MPYAPHAAVTEQDNPDRVPEPDGLQQLFPQRKTVTDDVGQHQSDEAHGKHIQRTLGQTEMRQVKREACACCRHNAFDNSTRLQSGIRAEEYPRKRGKAEGDNHADDLQPACIPRNVQCGAQALLCRCQQAADNLKNAEQQSSEHIFHGGTVPQAAQCEHDQHVDVGARFAFAAAAEREI